MGIQSVDKIVESVALEPVGESIGGRVTMTVVTALSPVPSVISFQVGVIIVTELAAEGKRAEGVAIMLKSFAWWHVGTKIGMLLVE